MNPSKRILLLAGFGIAILGGLLPARALWAGEGDSIRPIVAWTGAHSRIVEVRYVRITGDDAWTALWLEHVGAPPKKPYDRYYNRHGVPEVDFSRHMVLAVFQGKKWNSAGVFPLAVADEKERILLRFDDKYYQTKDEGADEVTAFGIFVLPKSDKAVVFEENVQNLKGKPPKWKERASLPAIERDRGPGPGEPLHGLKLVLNLSQGRVKAGESFQVTLAFENVSGEALTFYVPDRASTNTFPTLRFRKRGDPDKPAPVFRRYDPPVQTLVPSSIHLLGELVTLDPGERRVFTYAVKNVVEEKEGGGGLKDPHLPFRPGAYEVAASYAKNDDTVEYTTREIFGKERRIVDGLWTGKIDAAPLTLVVEPSVGVFCELEAPEPLTPGKPAVLRGRIRNATDQRLHRHWILMAQLYSKACGGGEFENRFERILDLPPWKETTFEIHLDRQNFTATTGPFKGKKGVGFFELFGPGIIHIAAEVTFPGGPALAPLKSNDLWARVAGKKPPAIEDFSLTLSAKKTTLTPGEKAEVTAKLVNESKEPRNICRRLDFPSRLYLVIEDADGKKKTLFACTGKAPLSVDGLWDVPWEGSAKIVRGLSWNRDLFETGKPLEKTDFAPLEPAAGVERTLDLNGLVHGGLKPGRYKIHAVYRNFETGRRFGLTDPAEVGAVKSDPIVLEVEVPAPPKEEKPHSMKGWELYSWKNPGDAKWCFSLLPGTNRIKSYEEVTAEASVIYGLTPLLEALRALPKGEWVMWVSGRVTVPERKPAFTRPSEDVVERIADFCEKRGLKFRK
ncbi:MAG: hypothetical protein ACYS47_01910 [Planctomycetota bacterium]